MSLSLVSHKTDKLTGHFDVPGDKSISHRSMILSAIAIGRTRVSGLLEGDDVMATKQAMIDCGAQIQKQSDDYISLMGLAWAGLPPPQIHLTLAMLALACAY